MEVSKASSAQLPLTAGALGATALGALGLHLVYLAGNTAATSLLTFDADASRGDAPCCCQRRRASLADGLEGGRSRSRHAELPEL